MRRERTGLAVLALVAGVGACAATEPPATLPTETRAASTEGLGEVAALAKRTLSDHLSVSAKEIQIVSINPIEWPDSSLGCAKPDRGYTQVITPGHQVVLQHHGREYGVHMAGKRAFVCEPAADFKEKVGKLPPIVILTPESVQLVAKGDLAQRLGVTAEDITVASTKRVEWPDTSLGCPKPDEKYMRQRAKGYVLELQHRGRSYTYHADMRRVLPCPDIDRS
jgi:hypothetical protein